VLDLPTLSIVAGAISLLQSLTLGVVGIYNRTVKGIHCWALAALLNGAAMPLIAMRSLIDSALLTKLLPTSMNFVAAYLFYVGAVRFRSQRWPRHWPLLAVLPLYAIYAWVILQDEGLRYRPLLTSPIFICFLALGARELLKESRPALRFSSRLMGFSALLMAAVFAYRGGALYMLETPAELFDAVVPQLVTFTGIILWSLLWKFGAMMLINQRQTFENAQLYDEKLRNVEELAAAETELIKLRTLQHRQQLASDLHDGFGGITANLAMLAFQGSIEDKPPQQKVILQHIEFLATEWNRELRLWMNGVERGNLCWGDSLAEARSYAERLTAAKGIELHWCQSGRQPSAPETRVREVISLMRVLKEAINNLVRHSEARSARVHIAFRPKLLGIVIKDDGIGFDPADVRQGGRGLEIMRRRINELGGGFKCRGREGTTLCLALPLPLPRSAGMVAENGEGRITLTM
jgi:signal transduction histidine kinase